MNEIIKIDESTQTVSARELHEKLKIGRDFSTWIKTEIAEFNLIQGKDYSPIPGKTPGVNGRPSIEYSLTIESAMKIAASQNNDTGREFLEHLIKHLSTPKTRELTRLELLEIAIDSEKKRIEAEEKLSIAEPKAAQYDLLMDSKKAISIGDFAKTIGFGRNKLFELLRYAGILMSDNVPYQDYIDGGYFEVKLKMIGTGEAKPVTLITPRGMDYITKKMNWSLAIK